MLISKIFGKIGIQAIIKFICSFLGEINSDVTKQASLSLLRVDEAIKKEEISKDSLVELEKIKHIEADLDAKTLNSIHQTIRAEMSSSDKFIRFWRPLFGYSVAVAWFLNIATICYIVITDKTHAAQIIIALTETTSLWGVALGVLGVSVVKSNQDKRH